MDKEKEIIKELNIVFKKLGWKLLPENNKYPGHPNYNYWYWTITYNILYVDRDYISYEKHINKFTIQQLDNYVIEFIKNICLKYKLNEIRFGDKNHKYNKIILK